MLLPWGIHFCPISFLVWAGPVSWEDFIHCIIPSSSTHFLHLEYSDLKIVTDLEPFWALFRSLRVLKNCRDFKITKKWNTHFSTPLVLVLQSCHCPKNTVPSKRCMVSQILWVMTKDRLPCGSVVKNPPDNAGDARDVGLTSGSGSSHGVRNGNPLQYSCLGNSIDRGAWWAIVYGVSKESDTTAVTQQETWLACVLYFSSFSS